MVVTFPSWQRTGPTKGGGVEVRQRTTLRPATATNTDPSSTLTSGPTASLTVGTAATVVVVCGGVALEWPLLQADKISTETPAATMKRRMATGYDDQCRSRPGPPPFLHAFCAIASRRLVAHVHSYFDRPAYAELDIGVAAVRAGLFLKLAQHVLGRSDRITSGA